MTRPPFKQGDRVLYPTDQHVPDGKPIKGLGQPTRLDYQPATVVKVELRKHTVDPDEWHVAVDPDDGGLVRSFGAASLRTA